MRRNRVVSFLLLLMMLSSFSPFSVVSEPSKAHAALADCGNKLEEANQERARKESEYQEARRNLKNLLLKAFLRLGLQTGVVIGDAATDLQLAIKKLKDSVSDDAARTKAARAQAEMLAEFERLSQKAARARAAAQAQRELAEALAKVLEEAEAPKTTKGETEKPPAPQSPEKVLKTKGVLPDKAQSDVEKGVTIFTPGERQKYRVTVKDGKLYDSAGNLLDTSHSGMKGRAIYVMDADGNIYVHTDPIQDKIHHSSLGAGMEVAAAGEIRIEDGVLTHLDRNSGHYRLGPEYLHQAMQRLKDLGIDPSTYDHGW